MKKILLSILLLGTLTGAGCEENSGATNAVVKEAAKDFAIVLEEGNVVAFDETDIETYDPTTRTFVLTETGKTKLQSYQSTEEGGTGLYQKRFIVKLGDTEIYTGLFWSALSSRSVEEIVMLDFLLLDPENPTLTVANSYPASDDTFITLIDDPSIAERFKEINKLKE